MKSPASNVSEKRSRCQSMPAVLWMIALLALWISGCNGSTNLAFTDVTHVENNFDLTTRSTTYAPSLAVAARPEELDQFSELVDPSAMAELEKLDFATEFLILARLGNKPSLHFAITIDRVSRSGNIITVHAIVTEPQPNIAAESSETSPYHLVRVTKTGEWNDDFDFALVVDGATVATLTHFLP